MLNNYTERNEFEFNNKRNTEKKDQKIRKYLNRRNTEKKESTPPKDVLKQFNFNRAAQLKNTKTDIVKRPRRTITQQTHLLFSNKSLTTLHVYISVTTRKSFACMCFRTRSKAALPSYFTIKININTTFVKSFKNKQVTNFLTFEDFNHVL